MRRRLGELPTALGGIGRTDLADLLRSIGVVVAGQPAVPGVVKLALLRRLCQDWRTLADVLDVRADRRRQFGNISAPGRVVWQWLEDRELPLLARLVAEQGQRTRRDE